MRKREILIEFEKQLRHKLTNVFGSVDSYGNRGHSAEYTLSDQKVDIFKISTAKIEQLCKVIITDLSKGQISKLEYNVTYSVAEPIKGVRRAILRVTPNNKSLHKFFYTQSELFESATTRLEKFNSLYEVLEPLSDGVNLHGVELHNVTNLMDSVTKHYRHVGLFPLISSAPSGIADLHTITIKSQDNDTGRNSKTQRQTSCQSLLPNSGEHAP